jgi:hypothetical protein
LAKKPRLDSILRSDLEELSEDVFLEAIPRGERDILVDILLPGNPVDLAEKRRLSNYIAESSTRTGAPATGASQARMEQRSCAAEQRCS